eukprot:7138897-Prymnesium_polylepis.2
MQRMGDRKHCVVPKGVKGSFFLGVVARTIDPARIPQIGCPVERLAVVVRLQITRAVRVFHGRQLAPACEVCIVFGGPLTIAGFHHEESSKGTLTQHIFASPVLKFCEGFKITHPEVCRAHVHTRVVRRKNGKFSPSLSVGLNDDGETIGVSWRPATCAAGIEASEQPAPMMTSTPSPLKAFLVSCSAPARPLLLSQLSSRYANSSDVCGSRSSATPSVLLLISSSAWYTPTRGVQYSKVLMPASAVSLANLGRCSAPNMPSSTPIRTVVTRWGATCGGWLLSAVE